uniref:Uncharacterized protein n=1 Tax=Rhizophora mucronata TaxID=61149 RepID=A0A2P2QYY5_RHIMU
MSNHVGSCPYLPKFLCLLTSFLVGESLGDLRT